MSLALYLKIWSNIEVLSLLFFISQRMFLKSVSRSLPTDRGHRGSPIHLTRVQVASDGYNPARVGCWLCYFVLSVHVSPLTSLAHSMDQRVGWVCLMGTREKTQSLLFCLKMLMCKYLQHLPEVPVSSVVPAHSNWPFYFFSFVSSRAGMLYCCSLWAQKYFPPLSCKFWTSHSLRLLPGLWLFCAWASQSCGQSPIFSSPSSISSPSSSYTSFFPLSSSSFLSEKHRCCVCNNMFQTSFQPY